MSGLDMLSNNYRSRKYASYVPTEFGEVMGTRFLATAYEQPDSFANIPENVNIISEMGTRNKLIKERLKTDDPYSVIDVSDIDEKYSNPNTAGVIEALKLKNERLDQYIKKQREIDPQTWGDIKTREEIHAPMIGRTQEARRLADDVAERAESTTAAVGGSLVGGFGGAMTGVVNLATLPLGFGAGRGVLQTMAAEGVLNAAIEAVQIPMRQEWMDTLGHKYGLREQLTDVAFAGVGAAGLTGVIRGGAAGTRAAGRTVTRKFKSFQERGSKGLEVMSEMSDNVNIPKDGRDALKYQSRIAHIDEEIPLKDPTPTEIGVHRANLNEVQDAINQGREPVFQDFTTASRYQDGVAEMAARLQAIRNPLPKQPAKRPLIQYLREKGGVRLDSPLASELNNIGLNSRSAPGLFKRNGGLSDFDNIPRVELEDTLDMQFRDDGAGYVDRDDLLEKIRDEQFAERGVEYDAELDEALQRAGLDVNDVTPEQAYDALVGRYFDEDMATRLEFDYGMDRAQAEQAARITDISDYADSLDVALPDERGGIAALQATVEAGENTASAFEADFARLLRDNPELKVDIDGEMVSIRDLNDQFQQDINLINAMKVCAIG
jgi:hypothetical protein